MTIRNNKSTQSRRCPEHPARPCCFRQEIKAIEKTGCCTSKRPSATRPFTVCPSVQPTQSLELGENTMNSAHEFLVSLGEGDENVSNRFRRDQCPRTRQILARARTAIPREIPYVRKSQRVHCPMQIGIRLSDNVRSSKAHE